MNEITEAQYNDLVNGIIATIKHVSPVGMEDMSDVYEIAEQTVNDWLNKFSISQP
jgi:hypothetical protein